jgi:hypothetical protein
MIDVLRKFYPESRAQNDKKLSEFIPAHNRALNSDPALAKRTLAKTAKTLGLKA